MELTKRVIKQWVLRARTARAQRVPQRRRQRPTAARWRRNTHSRRRAPASSTASNSDAAKAPRRTDGDASKPRVEQAVTRPNPASNPVRTWPSVDTILTRWRGSQLFESRSPTRFNQHGVDPQLSRLTNVRTIIKNCGKTVSESVGVPTTVARRATKTQTASEHREFHSDDDSVPQQHGDIGTLTVDGALQRRRQRRTATRPRPHVEQAVTRPNPASNQSERGPALTQSWLVEEAPNSSEVDPRLNLISTELISNFLAWQTYAR